MKNNTIPPGSPAGVLSAYVLPLVLNYALYVVAILLLGVYAALSPVFLSHANITGLLANSSPLLIVATGMTIVLLVGEIDLSVGSIAGVASMVWLMAATRWGLSMPAATVLALFLGAAMGAANGVLVVGLRINSFLATLGMQILLRGVDYIICASRISINDGIRNFTNSSVLGVSPLVIIGVAIVAAMALIYRYISFGRRLQAIGCDRAAAIKVGINARRTVFLSFVLCGVLAGVGGIVQVANVGVANAADTGMGMEFLAITAVVLGGTSLFGGKGSFVPGTLIGVIFLMAIENGLGVLSVDPYLYPIVRGVIIFLAMLMDSLRRLYLRRQGGYY